ncbi:hypothetical protein BAE44_0013033 [Dichanthelium oligosanthes]|uniref:Uncharacterized protein n=1 Tax=Dichanthelium oligosanthes TaxID=888268 RepID=A0A1E5VLD7_9POAL|nr:hypothetical protein BAE44_0013033 [Dichanthelium oligosanthes]
MAVETTTAAASSCDWKEFLLDGYAYIGDKRNHTTAADFTRSLDRIVASFWSERQLLPSRLYVHCPDLDPSSFSQLPCILRMVEGLILFRVAIRCRQPRFIFKDECDYFIYDVDGTSLQRIPGPHPVSLRDDDVGSYLAVTATSSPRWAEFLQPEAYVLAIDMGNGELQGVTEFGTVRELCADVICHHGSVSKYN